MENFVNGCTVKCTTKESVINNVDVGEEFKLSIETSIIDGSDEYCLTPTSIRRPLMYPYREYEMKIYFKI